MSSLNYIDLFAGCGGLSLGLHQAGWKGLFAIEKSPMAFETLKYNLIDKKEHFDWPEWLSKRSYDINYIISHYKKELENLRGNVTLLAGGPPCQGFSHAGKRNEKDQRNKLVNAYIKFVKIVQPKILLFENVKGFTEGFNKGKRKGKVYSNIVVKKLENLGYNVHAEIINFGDFGVPQDRKRFILVGMRKGNASLFFSELVRNKKSFLEQKGLNEKTPVEDAISDLLKKHGLFKSEKFKQFYMGKYNDAQTSYQMLMRYEKTHNNPDSHRFSNHTDATIKKFKYVLNTCMRKKNISKQVNSEFKLNKHTIIALSGKERCPTLTTLPDDYIHYHEPRILTVREYARIQSFPDWYEFKSKYTTGGKHRKIEVPRYSQIGNAIPPLFSELAGNVLKNIIETSN